jgi:hypothetical protein
VGWNTRITFFWNYVSNLQKLANSASFFFFKFPDSSLWIVTVWPNISAEQHHRSFFQSNEAVAVNSPEKVKIFKNLKKTHKGWSGSGVQPVAESVSAFGCPSSMHPTVAGWLLNSPSPPFLWVHLAAKVGAADEPSKISQDL